MPPLLLLFFFLFSVLAAGGAVVGGPLDGNGRRSGGRDQRLMLLMQLDFGGGRGLRRSDQYARGLQISITLSMGRDHGELRETRSRIEVD